MHRALLAAAALSAGERFQTQVTPGARQNLQYVVATVISIPTCAASLAVDSGGMHSMQILGYPARKQSWMQWAPFEQTYIDLKQLRVLNTSCNISCHAMDSNEHGIIIAVATETTAATYGPGPLSTCRPQEPTKPFFPSCTT